MATARLVKRAWLLRRIELRLPEGVFAIEYNGRGAGYESVSVNGRVAARRSGLLRFVPRFSFRVGDRPAALEVRVWAWLGLRSLLLKVDGATVYEWRTSPWTLAALAAGGAAALYIGASRASLEKAGVPRDAAPEAAARAGFEDTQLPLVEADGSPH